MTAPHLDALLREVDGTAELGAPRVGAFAARVSIGALVTAGESIGTITVLTKRFEVRVPPGCVGRVTRLPIREHGVGVEWGQTLATIAPIDAVDAGPPAPIDGMVDDDLPAGAFVFEAPMDGQFYRRPSPDEPIFADEGAVVAPGATIGLIEVMKFFYPVVWDGDAPMRVHRAMAPDATSVEAGAPLVVLVPVESEDV